MKHVTFLVALFFLCNTVLAQENITVNQLILFGKIHACEEKPAKVYYTIKTEKFSKNRYIRVDDKLNYIFDISKTPYADTTILTDIYFSSDVNAAIENRSACDKINLTRILSDLKFIKRSSSKVHADINVCFEETVEPDLPEELRPFYGNYYKYIKDSVRYILTFDHLAKAEFFINQDLVDHKQGSFDFNKKDSILTIRFDRQYREYNYVEGRWQIVRGIGFVEQEKPWRFKVKNDKEIMILTAMDGGIITKCKNGCN